MMREFKGTPGPWEFLSIIRGGGVGVTDGDEHFPICDRPKYSGGKLTNEYNANMKLIAASPELLEALQDMLSGWKYIRSVHGDLYGVGWDRSEDKAKLAINKALGITE